jgi:hypothetical protein
VNQIDAASADFSGRMRLFFVSRDNRTINPRFNQNGYHKVGEK